MYQSEVPIHRDTTQEGNADVYVLVEKNSTDFAHGLVVGPIVMLENVLEPEGQREDVEKIGQGEVD